MTQPAVAAVQGDDGLSFLRLRMNARRSPAAVNNR